LVGGEKEREKRGVTRTLGPEKLKMEPVGKRRKGVFPNENNYGNGLAEKKNGKVGPRRDGGLKKKTFRGKKKSSSWP